jgi:hypothetical protein
MIFVLIGGLSVKQYYILLYMYGGIAMAVIEVID